VETLIEGQTVFHNMLGDSVELPMRIGQDCIGYGLVNGWAYSTLRDFNIH
jgi:hypothetical protein